MKYKQKQPGKDIALLDTPIMKKQIQSNKLQSELVYRDEFNKTMKGKGWKFDKDNKTQNHVENANKLQSQVFLFK